MKRAAATTDLRSAHEWTAPVSVTVPSLTSTRIRRASRSARRSRASSMDLRTCSVTGFAGLTVSLFTTNFTPERFRTARSASLR